MDDSRKEIIKDIVYKYASLAKINNNEMCDNLVERLSSLNADDCIDAIIISLYRLYDRRLLTEKDIFSNVDLILSLNSSKYHTKDDLISRLNWIRSMNLEYSEMPLTENHKLVIEVFDKFNSLIGTGFDAYYTGGLMGYLATNHPLERYHGDLDLFINEDQLEELYHLVQNSDEFEFVSNMDHKELNGHEYKVSYKGAPISIGLFLFSRLPNKEVVLKRYYYPKHDKDLGLFVDEHHLSSEYASMMFSNQIKEHNGTYYKMQTLESIYNAKKKSRPKDKYDANIIKDFVNLNIDHKLDTEKQDNYDVNNQSAENSKVQQMEVIIENQRGKHK